MPRPPAGDGERLSRPDAGRSPAPPASRRLGDPEPPAVLVLLGPTGTGKSRVAVEVAEAIGGEIVGCDALQVYRGFDAATGKPPARDRERVRHWVVDHVDPRRDYSVADYVKDADAAIASILEAGRVPIVVGGTGMYLRALLKGLVAAPPRDDRLRERIRAFVARRGLDRARRVLLRLDPASAGRIAPGDRQRVVRALELALTPGGSWSERLASEGAWMGAAERYRALKLGLDIERSALAARLAARVDAFFEAGLVEEVAQLLADGLPAHANALKAIGYREVAGALHDGRDPAATRAEIVAATARYAKRQRTWFRSEPGVVWLDATASGPSLARDIAAAWRSFAPPSPPSETC